MKYLIHTFCLILLTSASCAQSKESSTRRKVGGHCEGCEALQEYGDKKLSSVDTLPDYHEAGPKMVISGTIYKRDGKTPASNIILYLYHTDQTGNYTAHHNQTGWGKRHGYIRGWIKTDVDGRYKFYTLKPAPYPGGKIPAHIHPTIQEPGTNEYYIDEYLFDDDPFLTTEERSRQEKRGGSGIIKLTKDKDGTLIGTRDIILGLNIPGY